MFTRERERERERERGERKIGKERAVRQPATVPGAGGMIKDMADDEAIQATNDDASECKRYAVQLGYWCDPFISLFVKQTARKAPEINRGYYARVKGIELFVENFLKVSV